MYRLNGTRKRQRSKCYKSERKERKTVTQVTWAAIHNIALWATPGIVLTSIGNNPMQPHIVVLTPVSMKRKKT